MVMVQKLSALACGIHDGLMADKKQLTDIQKQYMIRLNNFLNYILVAFIYFIFFFFRKIPSPIHYISYLLTYQTILAGPNAFFEDFMAYLDGSNFPKILPKEVNIINLT